MKKFITALCLFLLLPIVVAVAGCNNLSEGDDWVEVQSITYTTGNGSTTITSTYHFNVTAEDIEQAEYDSASAGYQLSIYSVSSEYKNWTRDTTINDISKSNFKVETDKRINETWYYNIIDYYSGEILSYAKITINSYTVNYVKVKAINDKVIEIDYNDEVKQVSTLSYEITYFKK